MPLRVSNFEPFNDGFARAEVRFAAADFVPLNTGFKLTLVRRKPFVGPLTVTLSPALSNAAFNVEENLEFPTEDLWSHDLLQINGPTFNLPADN